MLRGVVGWREEVGFGAYLYCVDVILRVLTYDKRRTEQWYYNTDGGRNNGIINNERLETGGHLE